MKPSCTTTPSNDRCTSPRSPPIPSPELTPPPLPQASTRWLTRVVSDGAKSVSTTITTTRRATSNSASLHANSAPPFVSENPSRSTHARPRTTRSGYSSKRYPSITRSVAVVSCGDLSLTPRRPDSRALLHRHARVCAAPPRSLSKPLHRHHGRHLVREQSPHCRGRASHG